MIEKTDMKVEEEADYYFNYPGASLLSLKNKHTADST
jgi:hypothetical protein